MKPLRIARASGKTALQITSENRLRAFIQKLHHIGADVDPQNKDLLTPLQETLLRGHTDDQNLETVLLLLEYGAEVDTWWEDSTRHVRDDKPGANALAENHEDPRIRALFSGANLPLMSRGANVGSGPWRTLITRKEAFTFGPENPNPIRTSLFDLTAFEVDVERRVMTLEKPFPGPKKSFSGYREDDGPNAKESPDDSQA